MRTKEICQELFYCNSSAMDISERRFMSKGSHVVTQKRVNATLRMARAEQDVSHRHS